MLAFTILQHQRPQIQRNERTEQRIISKLIDIERVSFYALVRVVARKNAVPAIAAEKQQRFMNEL